jgi:hypothetical protein
VGSLQRGKGLLAKSILACISLRPDERWVEEATYLIRTVLRLRSCSIKRPPHRDAGTGSLGQPRSPQFEQGLKTCREANGTGRDVPRAIDDSRAPLSLARIQSDRDGVIARAACRPQFCLIPAR